MEVFFKLEESILLLIATLFQTLHASVQFFLQLELRLIEF
jgi:hypothetical protein